MLNNEWKVCAWGHSEEHGSTHTHRYIHQHFIKAFRHLGYHAFHSGDTYDPNINYNKTLFIAEWQEAKNIPLREDCFYILHNCTDEKYNSVYKNKNAIRLGVYNDDVWKYGIPEKEKCIHYDIENSTIYMPWASDLLPHEIEANKPSEVFRKNSNVVHWIGTVGAGEGGNINEIQPFINACKENNIIFNNAMMVPDNQAINRIKNSYMAPSISGTWQKKVKYIPCRIFKNISYGQFGITNNSKVNELFGNKLIFNENEYELFYDAKSTLTNLKLKDLHELMDEVKEKHTYLNRINTLLDFISQVNPSSIGQMILK